MSATPSSTAAVDAAAPVPTSSFDWIPLALVAGLVAAALPLIGSTSSWLTLTIAGLAMGMIIFIIASGLTLVFGLMDVLNFGHGVFIALGAFVATSVMGGMGAWAGADSLVLNLAAIFLAMLAAMAAAGAHAVVLAHLFVVGFYGGQVCAVVVHLIFDNNGQRQPGFDLRILIRITQTQAKHRIHTFGQAQQIRDLTRVIAQAPDITDAQTRRFGSDHRILGHQCHIHSRDNKLLSVVTGEGFAITLTGIACASKIRTEHQKLGGRGDIRLIAGILSQLLATLGIAHANDRHTL